MNFNDKLNFLRYFLLGTRNRTDYRRLKYLENENGSGTYLNSVQHTFRNKSRVEYFEQDENDVSTLARSWEYKYRHFNTHLPIITTIIHNLPVNNR